MIDDSGRDEVSGLVIEIAIDDPELANWLRAVEPSLRELSPGRRPLMRVVIADSTDVMAENRLDARYIILADHTEMDAALRSGAAVLPRSAGAAALKLAVAALLQGFIVVPAAQVERHDGPRRGSDLADAFTAEDQLPVLTTRELEVLTALAEGASNKVIARRLDISVHTAKFHVASILQKLGASSRTDAVTRAVRLGVLML